MIKKILMFILLIFVLFTIFMFSNQNSKESGDISKKVGRDVVTVIDTVTNQKIEGKLTKEKFVKKKLYYIRKIAHITEYIILAIVLLGLISQYKVLNYKYILISIGVCILFACFDEAHQLFIKGRTGKIIDIVIDTFGILTGTLIYYLFYINGKGKKKN